MTRLRYHEAAEAELLREVGYLERRTQKLGRRFFSEVRRSEELILQFPQAAEEIVPGIRKRLLRQFRYALIYTVEREGLLILAEAHQSHRPGYWLSRIYPENDSGASR